jgi:DNA-binding transcriptional ArsR family regulator
MRQPKHRNSQLLKPLDEILGTPTNVRLLRVLALRRTAVTAGELAKDAMLSRTSIYPALRQLELAGIVELVGAGSQKPVQLRDRHPLSRILKDLFQAEARRFAELTMALRKLHSDLPRPPLSAWLDESVYDAQSGDALRLYVVAKPGDLEIIADYLNEHLSAIERKYDVHIAVQGLTRSELDTLPSSTLETANAIVLLAGVPPTALTARSGSAASAPALMSHDEHDARSRKLALALAAKIRRDPGLIANAIEHIERRAEQASARERRELTEWARLLSTMSPARLQKFLAEGSERAVRLRQTLPALGLLSPAERDAVVHSKTDADVIAAVTRR